MTTLPPIPDWLSKHDGGLSPGLAGYTVFVRIGSEPQYRLDARPAGGQFVCQVTQTINGKALGDATKYESTLAALTGGLETLRAKLGW